MATQDTEVGYQLVITSSGDKDGRVCQKEEGFERACTLGPTSISALVTRLRSPPLTPRTRALPTLVSATRDSPSVRIKISMRTPVPHTCARTKQPLSHALAEPGWGCRTFSENWVANDQQRLYVQFQYFTAVADIIYVQVMLPSCEGAPPARELSGFRDCGRLTKAG